MAQQEPRELEAHVAGGSHHGRLQHGARHQAINSRMRALNCWQLLRVGVTIRMVSSPATVPTTSRQRWLSSAVENS